MPCSWEENNLEKESAEVEKTIVVYPHFWVQSLNILSEKTIWLHFWELVYISVGCIWILH